MDLGKELNGMPCGASHWTGTMPRMANRQRLVRRVTGGSTVCQENGKSGREERVQCVYVRDMYGIVCMLDIVYV